MNNVVVAGLPLPHIDSIKSLGVYIDADLSFDSQVMATCCSCNYRICTFWQIRNWLPTDVAKSGYFAFTWTRICWWTRRLTLAVNCATIKPVRWDRSDQMFLWIYQRPDIMGSQLDYCNSLLYVICALNLQKLQSPNNLTQIALIGQDVHQPTHYWCHITGGCQWRSTYSSRMQNQNIDR